MYRGHVAFSGDARAFRAVKPGDLVVSVVQCRGEMSGSSSRFTAPDWSVINEHDGPAGSRKKIGSGHSRDASSDYTHVRAHILANRLELGDLGRVHPDRGRVT